MKTSKSPYTCHLFICNKSRGGERKSCGDGNKGDLKALLKDEVKKRGWKSRVRVSESSCLGVCDAGPNIMLYPQQIWFSEVTEEDTPAILQSIADALGE